MAFWIRLWRFWNCLPFFSVDTSSIAIGNCQKINFSLNVLLQSLSFEHSLIMLAISCHFAKFPNKHIYFQDGNSRRKGFKTKWTDFISFHISQQEMTSVIKKVMRKMWKKICGNSEKVQTSFTVSTECLNSYFSHV